MALSFHFLYLVVMYPTLVFPLISYRRLGLAHLFDKRWPLAVKFFPFLSLRIGCSPCSLLHNDHHSNSTS